MIYELTPPRNPISNLKHILKKNTYIKKKYVQFIFRVNRDPNNPYYVLKSHLGGFKKWFVTSPHSKIKFWTPHTEEKYVHSLRKISIFFTKTHTFFSKRNWEPNHLYYDLHIPLETLEKWFEVFPCLEKDFGTPHISTRKISTFFTREP